MIMNGHLTFFHVKQSDFQDIKWFLSYTQKIYKKGEKLLEERLYKSKTNKYFNFKIWHYNSKTNIHILYLI